MKSCKEEVSLSSSPTQEEIPRRYLPRFCSDTSGAREPPPPASPMDAQGVTFWLSPSQSLLGLHLTVPVLNSWISQRNFCLLFHTTTLSIFLSESSNIPKAVGNSGRFSNSATDRSERTSCSRASSYESSSSPAHRSLSEGLSQFQSGLNRVSPQRGQQRGRRHQRCGNHTQIAKPPKSPTRCLLGKARPSTHMRPAPALAGRVRAQMLVGRCL